jgi:hypothetical protein
METINALNTIWYFDDRSNVFKNILNPKDQMNREDLLFRMQMKTMTELLEFLKRFPVKTK